MPILLLLFIIVPAAELALLIEVGGYLGTLPTIGLIVLTGVLGAYLARMQGLSVLRRAQERMALGEIPAGSLADGVMILVAAALLVTPGIMTDGFGFLLLVPAFRNVVKDALRERFRRAVEENRLRVHVSTDGFQTGEDPVLDVRAHSSDETDSETPKYKIH